MEVFNLNLIMHNCTYKTILSWDSLSVHIYDIINCFKLVILMGYSNILKNNSIYNDKNFSNATNKILWILTKTIFRLNLVNILNEKQLSKICIFETFRIF